MGWVVLGATGIGKYHVREIQRNGYLVDAILGSSEESAKKTARSLQKEYGFCGRFYGSIERLLSSEKNIEGAIISTPLGRHRDLIETFLNKQIPVLCEKPLVGEEIILSTEHLINLARKNNTLLSVNNQWPAILEQVELPKNINHIRIYSEPGERGQDLLFDHLSHANSLVIKLFPYETVQKIFFSKIENERIDLSFECLNGKETCMVDYTFCFNENRPRKLNISLNRVDYERVIGKNYSQIIKTGRIETPLVDPFAISVGRFLKAVGGNGVPLISLGEIEKNAFLQEQILMKYNSLINKPSLKKI